MGITQHQSRLPVPIAQMNPWAFWSRADALGLPPDVAAAISDGTATPEQEAIAQSFAEAAKHFLISASGVYPERATS